MDRIYVAPPMFKPLLVERMGRDCAPVHGVSDRTFRAVALLVCVELVLGVRRGREDHYRVRAIMTVLVSSHDGSDHDLLVPYLRGSCFCG